MSRRGNGRQRIVIAKMEKESARQVTFSKRRSGLMKKGSELCILCGAEVAIVVFSPGGKVFSFGNPCIESVIRKFLNEEPEFADGSQEIVQAHRDSKQSKLNFHLSQLESLIEAEQKKATALEQMMTSEHEHEGNVWWEQSMENLSLEQMELFMASMESFRDNVNEKACMLKQANEVKGDVTLLDMFDRKGKRSMFSELRVDCPSAFQLGGRVSFDTMGEYNSRIPMEIPLAPKYYGGASFEPLVDGFNACLPLDPRVPKLGGRVSIDGLVGTAMLDPRTIGLGGGFPIGPMTIKADSEEPLEPITYNPIMIGSDHKVSCISGTFEHQVKTMVDLKTTGTSNGKERALLADGPRVSMMSHGSNQVYGREY